VNRIAVIKILVAHGCFLYRHGSSHDIYMNPINGRKAPVPRHNEIKDSLLRLIQKQLGIEE